jgi:mono/diheme cytochrome c family protein
MAVAACDNCKFTLGVVVVGRINSTRSLVLIFIAVFVLEHAAMLFPAAKRKVLPERQDRAVRGRIIAEQMGCFGCHGAEGVRGISNPGAPDGVVPALAGGEIMMWAQDEAELRAWIRDGHIDKQAPRRDGLDAGRSSGRALVMPAYGEMLDREQLDDLVLYLKSISGLQFPEDDDVADGLELMHKLGCFRCHGAMGTGGVSNPQSLKGYVPGFVGEDYPELVRDGAELRQWIRNGVSDRFADNRIARSVLERQALKMPAYGKHLGDDDVEALAAAVEWLASEDWRKQPVP